MIARELKIDETPVWKVMTRHPIFVLSDTLAVEALQKMVQGMHVDRWRTCLFCSIPFPLLPRR